jgi:hypothetical protein
MVRDEKEKQKIELLEHPRYKNTRYITGKVKRVGRIIIILYDDENLRFLNE